MSVRVTFDIFSGRANPAFTLGASDAAELSKRLQPAAKLTGAAATPPAQSVLGYRGVLIEPLGPAAVAGLPAHARVVDGTLYAPGTAFRIQGSDTEDYLLDRAAATAGSGLSPELIALLREESRSRAAAKSNPPPPAGANPGPALVCRCAPLYEPGWWNDGGQIQLHNNCYNYACDYRTDTFAQPGRAAGNRITQFSCPGVQPCAIDDALTVSPQQAVRCPGEGHLVALVIWPGWDFHWYRMGRELLWSHKPGNWPVTNLDNAGQRISDPRTADRGRYTAFCSFMIAMHGHIKID